MKRADWFREPERPRGSAPTAIPPQRWEDEPEGPPRAALVLAWVVVGVGTVLGAIATLWALS